MVGRNVQQNGNVGTEVEHIVQLKRREFDHVPVYIAFGYLQRETASDVAGEAYVKAGLLQDMINE